MTTRELSKAMLTRAALISLIAVLALSGCSEARRALGYDKTPPDEFTVVSQAPLSQPPDYSLRPPEPGAPRPQQGGVRDQAADILLNTSSSKRALAAQQAFRGRSQGEQVLLAKSSAEKALPDIRKTVNEETTKLIEADKSFTDKILFWQKKDAPGEPLDAKKEAERLSKNSAEGKAVDDGNSPQIVRRKKGWLEGIF